MAIKRQRKTGEKRIDAIPLNATIKSKISRVLRQKGIAFKEIILFGSRARGEFDKFSDYDILVIVKEQIETREKIDIIEAIRTDLAELLISSDIILKSQTEAEYYKEKIGSVVREAFKEGVPL